MKSMKKGILLLLAMVLMLAFTACKEEKAPAAGTEAGNQEQLSEEEINDRVMELLQEREAVIAEQQELWDRVFMAEKDQVNAGTAEDETVSGKDYYLKLIEMAGDALSEEEAESLKKDVDRICDLEAQLDPLFEQLNQGMDAETDPSASEWSVDNLSKFPNFQTMDLDGNDVDESIFSQNAVTLVNFWFNECSPCISEIPALDALNQEMKEKGGAVLGINADGGSGEEGIAAAKEILKSLNATYQNIYFDGETDAGKLLASVQAFPTSLLIDRDGNVVGDPIVGSIEGEKMMQQVKERMEEIIQKDAEK